MVATKAKTVPVRVKVYTEEHVITGLLHTKPGGYRDRVSDMVNDVSTRFLVLTEATFRPVKEASALAKRCNTLVVRLEDVKLLIPFENDVEERSVAEPGEFSNW